MVAVPIVRIDPIDDFPSLVGLLGCQRNIPPVGEFCMPGGYVERHESWEEAAIREVKEETGVSIIRAVFKGIESVDGFLMIYCASEGIQEQSIDFNFNNDETQRLLLLDKPQKLAFNVQTEYLKRAFNQ